MLGGYQILDLRKIDLTITKTQSTITNDYVLAQLLKLRDFIDKDYDFSKPIENQLKPVLIRYRDKKNGEKNEGAMFGELAIVENYYTFQITGRISGYLILTIKVAFQEITNAYGAKEWVINTAKIKLQDVMDDLEGNLALEGDLSVSGDVAVGGDLEINGDAKIYEKIIDTNSNNRFIEGDITMETIEGITPKYCKWALSGSHLLIVCAFDIDANTSLTAGDKLCDINLPAWVKDKIYPLFLNYVITNTYPAWTNGGLRSDFNAYLIKQLDVVSITVGSNFSKTDLNHVRLAFDLLIDNE